jgi:hypothetical protein
MTRFDAEEFSGADGRVRHRPWPWRPSLGSALELNRGQSANQAHTAVGSGGAERPNAAAPMVVRARLVGPMSGAVHPVAAGAVGGLGVIQEPQGFAGKAVHGTRCVGLAGRHYEHSGHVIGAVPMVTAGLGNAGVLEGRAMVRHSQQVRENRGGRDAGHASAD